MRSTLLLFLFLVASCRDRAAPPLFERVSPEASGVDFANTLPQDSALNIVNYLYYYNGGGVAAGDVDGDGLVDLYFTSNLGRNRLYRNLGRFRFEDITDRAGVADSVGWKSGVTMADVNGDGHLDLYVSGVYEPPMRGRNVLYVNDGGGTFTDRTEEYGLGFAGYGTQAAFLDYDADGDLDMYLLTSSTMPHLARSRDRSRSAPDSAAGDRLYRNDGNRFVDVSAAAGIYGGVEGFGLGVAISDFDLDGCPDIYVANDFPENDFLYLNNCNGTFREVITQATGHTSRFSMGADAADFNNDGRPDIVVLDMLPDSEPILKTAASAESYQLFELKLDAGYHPQYARNTLQLNRGVVAGTLRFSEIGYLAGVAATDWSWAPLFADFDNDGLKDLFVTNGIYRRPNDLDYIASLDSGPPQLDRMPSVPIASYAFRNNGDLTFTNGTRDWGLGTRGFSNGAAYADLDNDGNLDLVINNFNEPAAIYRNVGSGGHYLTVILDGKNGGIGATVTITHGGTRQLVEAMPTRGFQSSVDPRLHFGLGATTRIDSLTVVWPDRRVQVITNVAVDTTITLSQADARARPSGRPAVRPSLFSDISAQLGITYRHRENAFFDFSREPMMPHLLSTEGPALAVGDANGDGLDDLYAGGAKWQPGELWVQRPDGRFRLTTQPAFQADSLHEDVDAAFFDADGDRDLDLYVVSGGNEFAAGEPLRDRLYLNERGSFRRGELPDFVHNGSCVVPADFNRDGHVDLFVGSRVVTRGYGATPRSHLLQGDGTGRFRDVTPEPIANAGMVSAAAWLDGDLVVVGEWMPVKIFHQKNGNWVERTLPASAGWWSSVQAADLNNDGRKDLILGNLGLNSFLRASAEQPVRLYLTTPPLLTSYRHGVSYPLAGRDELLQVLPQLRSRYPTYRSFGASRVEDIVPRDSLRKARVLEAQTFASAIALNRGDGAFELRPLPVEAQFAPVYASLTGDFDGDRGIDLLVAGNFYGVTPVRGRYDASYGLLLRGLGSGDWGSVDMEESGLAIEGQVRRMAFLTRANGERVIVVARNNDRLQFLRTTHDARRTF